MLTPEETYTQALARKAENRTFFKKLARMDRNKLDKLVHDAHDEVFEKTDCLECANCCRSLGPRITDADVGRIASALKIKPAQLVSDLLHRDEDGDLVFNSMPCPFIDSENYCSIYENRPRACREYPHTDRRRFYQVLEITLKNSFTCPAVMEIIEMLKLRL
ncbi:MAG: YkgJ family cysteine cluster protein [Bacteroidetes bacterium]|nr:YkgJ family cysteine cluster protein [Bacteroidota bacterium]